MENLPNLDLFGGDACADINNYVAKNGLVPAVLSNLAAYVSSVLASRNLWLVNTRRLDMTVGDTLHFLCGCSSSAVCREDQGLLEALTVRSKSARELNDILRVAVETRNGDLRLYNERRQRELSDDHLRLQHFAAALISIVGPTNKFVVDQVILSMKALGYGDAATLLAEQAVQSGLWGLPLQRPTSTVSIKGISSQSRSNELRRLVLVHRLRPSTLTHSNLFFSLVAVYSKHRS